MSASRAGSPADQSAISAIVRPQPRHQPVASSRVQTLMHGLGGTMRTPATTGRQPKVAERKPGTGPFHSADAS